MAIHEALFSSKEVDYATPQWLFDALDKEFQFSLDVCATDTNAKCEQYFTKSMDGLSQDWQGHRAVWMNPPYGKEIESWVQKAYEVGQTGTIVVALLPARVDTRWWYKYVTRAREIMYITGRLKFNEMANSAPFPSCLVVFQKHERKFPLVSTWRKSDFEDGTYLNHQTFVMNYFLDIHCVEAECSTCGSKTQVWLNAVVFPNEGRVLTDELVREVFCCKCIEDEKEFMKIHNQKFDEYPEEHSLN